MLPQIYRIFKKRVKFYPNQTRYHIFFFTPQLLPVQGFLVKPAPSGATCLQVQRRQLVWLVGLG
jgi:hypothetical protein